MFGYPCPSCAQPLLAAPERVGQRTICPKCLKPIVIPSPAAARPAPPMDEDEPDHIFAPVVVANTPLTHDVDGDQESALRADVAAQEDDMPPVWRDTVVPPIAAAALDATEMEVLLEPAVVTLDPVPPPPPPPVVRPFTPPPATPAPAALRRPGPALSARPPVADREAPGMVAFAPTATESADIAADLTAALTLRMKPPPEPPADLPLSTGLWLALTAVALSLWLVGTLYGPGPLGYVLVIGGLQAVLGLGWAMAHAARRGGPLGFLPPVALKHLLLPPPSLGHRPLRFVLTGGALLGLYFLAVPARPVARGLLGVTDAAPAVLPDLAETPLSRLAAARRQESMQPLLDVLRDLTAPAALLTAGPDGAKVTDELRRLAADDRPEVRAAALGALVTWDADGAKADVLSALRADDDRVRRAALGLAVRWKDPAVAAAVAARLADRDEASDAADTLRRIGGPTAEAAVLPLLAGRDLTARVYALDVLAEIGGDRAAVELEAAIERLKSEDTRRPYRQALTRIKERLKTNG